MTKKYNQGVADANRRRTRHGHATDDKKSKLYSTWAGIKRRCFNPSTKHYHRYGGRGITMHPAWADDFALFAKDVGEPPTPDMTFDRIDNAKGYEPGNTRWATRKEQANNRESNVRYTYDGVTKTLSEWATHLGCKYGLLTSRWKSGLRGYDLLAPPKFQRGEPVEYNGETHHLGEWSRITGIPYATLKWRHKHGKPLF
jgi:hypothetical protein